MRGALKWTGFGIVGLLAIVGLGTLVGSGGSRPAPQSDGAGPSQAQLEETVSARVNATVAALSKPAAAAQPTVTRPNPPAPAKPTTATAPEEKPVTLAGKGILKTPPFELRGGSYSIKWTASDSSTSAVGCYQGGQLQAVDGSLHFETVGNAMVPGGQKMTGETQAYNLKPGRYFLDMSSGCDWSVTIAPQ